MSKRLPILLVGVVLAGAIAFTSALPTQDKHALHTQGVLHPWLHFFAFAILSSIVLRAFQSPAIKVVLFAALLFFGWATEAHESAKDGWPIEKRDVHTDAIGVVLGSLASLFATPRRSS